MCLSSICPHWCVSSQPQYFSLVLCPTSASGVKPATWDGSKQYWFNDWALPRIHVGGLGREEMESDSERPSDLILQHRGLLRKQDYNTQEKYPTSNRYVLEHFCLIVRTPLTHWNIRDCEFLKSYFPVLWFTIKLVNLDFPLSVWCVCVCACVCVVITTGQIVPYNNLIN